MLHLYVGFHFRELHEQQEQQKTPSETAGSENQKLGADTSNSNNVTGKNSITQKSNGSETDSRKERISSSGHVTETPNDKVPQTGDGNKKDCENQNGS